MSASVTPYFSQWETPDMTLPVLAEGSAALLRDPMWRRSGADTVEEYAHWAVNLCGMACLKMILAARGDAHPIMSLARLCTSYGGYIVNPNDASIKGLIYAPFVEFVTDHFGLSAETMTNVEADAIPGILSRRRYFMASVHHSIRWPERIPPSRGGHLVLVTSATMQSIRFHNPSGHSPASQADVHLPLADFDRFFANRGIAIDA